MRFFRLCPASSAIPCGFVACLHFSTAALTLQGGRAIGLPHRSILTAHRTPASLLLRLVTVDISNTDPAARRPTSSAATADTDGPLRVVLCSLECDALAWGNEIYVEDFPARRAVGVQDSRGATPELNQQVWLKRRSNPGVIQVWLGMKQWKSLHYFLFFIQCIQCKMKNFSDTVGVCSIRKYYCSSVFLNFTSTSTLPAVCNYQWNWLAIPEWTLFSVNTTCFFVSIVDIKLNLGPYDL